MSDRRTKASADIQPSTKSRWAETAHAWQCLTTPQTSLIGSREFTTAGIAGHIEWSKAFSSPHALSINEGTWQVRPVRQFQRGCSFEAGIALRKNWRTDVCLLLLWKLIILPPCAANQPIMPAANLYVQCVQYCNTWIICNSIHKLCAIQCTKYAISCNSNQGFPSTVLCNASYCTEPQRCFYTTRHVKWIRFHHPKAKTTTSHFCLCFKLSSFCLFSFPRFQLACIGNIQRTG